MLKRSLLALSLVLASGCASTPIELTEPPASAPSESGNGLAEIVVLRPGVFAYAVTFWILVNDENIGGIRSHDYVRKLVPPGTVHVTARSEAASKATFPVEANRAYYLLATPKMGWAFARVQLELMDPEEARKKLEDCTDQTRESAKTPSP